ncbi:hypothetical protein D6853_06535 [Butyrivibrio sp. X503]|nr:hypothetical protein D6853_06535 [Butyrivibrio sp. X503]
MIVCICVVALGACFFLYGLYLLLLNRICDTEIVAKYRPKDEPIRNCSFFAYYKDGKKIIANVQNLVLFGEQYQIDADYTVYVSERFPRILITTRKISALQILLAVSCILISFIFVGVAFFMYF